MHRQLINCGDIRQFPPGNNSHERWSKPSQQKLQIPLKTLPTTTTVAVRIQPLRNDVVCARGRTYWDHPGNQLYRKLISLVKNQYSKTPNRLGKSLIASQIIHHIHRTNGRFVKKVSRKVGVRWVECSQNFVREKVTQSLRDGLSFKYSSSTTRKRQRKAQVQENFYFDIDRIVHSNPTVSRKITDFKDEVEWMNRYCGTDSEVVADEILMKIFDAANLDILETMKKDQSMLDQLHRITNNEPAIRATYQHDSGRTMELIAPKTLLSQFQTTPPIWVSQPKLTNASSDTNNILHLNLAKATRENNQREQNNKDNSSCDDMCLDLESPFMFLDEVGGYRS
jgi:hypothetical protein